MQIGYKRGRYYQDNAKDETKRELIFTEPCTELEASIDSAKIAINNYTTQGYSVSGNYAHLATNNMANAVFMGTNDLY